MKGPPMRIRWISFALTVVAFVTETEGHAQEADTIP
jgi:hypothetical protein